MIHKLAIMIFSTMILLQACGDVRESIDAHEVNLVVLDFSQQVEGVQGGTAFDIAQYQTQHTQN